MKKVQGRRSPRWAVWQRMTIPCRDGLLYLVRLRILQVPWGGVYVHDIHEPDGDRDCHDHPWSFVSVVLRGFYVERVYPVPSDSSRWVERRHGRFSVHVMGRSSAHRITEAAPGLKTLILTGPRKSGWGFYVNGEYVPWEEYEAARPGLAAQEGVTARKDPPVGLSPWAEEIAERREDTDFIDHLDASLAENAELLARLAEND